ncbi:TRC40/GET3/ArsA family transport-energizing ATPase [Streptococcus jiangjianxini]|uniref:TRC40/GET3/ArsA family transport-energizing ATPase n=1 Tax=Streptococcus jiangjianxini TaxID=3161189 RepID=UPI0032ED51E9
MEMYQPEAIHLTKYLFFTGKGGVGKTSTASATATYLADKGKQVMLVSTDPASNLQDVFELELSNKGTKIPNVEGLVVANFDPVEAANDYKESIVGPYRGKLPDSVLENMEEQLSGSCTVEIASFNEFANFLTDKEASTKFDHIIFDTAPTGHTLLLLDSTQSYHKEIERSSGDIPESVQKLLPKLQNGDETEVVMVTLPEATPVYESIRLKDDLERAGIARTWWVVNNSMLSSGTTNPMLLARAQNEEVWIDKVAELSNNHYAVIEWKTEDISGDALRDIL